MTTDFESRADVGNELRRAGKSDESLAHFRLLLADYPNDPRAYYEYGGAFDSAGQPAEAINYYNRALELGLSEVYLPQIYLQFGSTLRNMGRLDEAVAMLEKAVFQFPERPSLKVFLAFTLESAGRSHDALTTLFDLAIANVHTPDMKRYDARAYIAARR